MIHVMLMIDREQSTQQDVTMICVHILHDCACTGIHPDSAGRQGLNAAHGFVRHRSLYRQQVGLPDCQ